MHAAIGHQAIGDTHPDRLRQSVQLPEFADPHHVEHQSFDIDRHIIGEARDCDSQSVGRTHENAGKILTDDSHCRSHRADARFAAAVEEPKRESKELVPVGERGLRVLRGSFTTDSRSSLPSANVLGDEAAFRLRDGLDLDGLSFQHLALENSCRG
jgi:hypothetical protein